MNQGGRLEGLARSFSGQLMRGEGAQFLIHQRKQLFRGSRVRGIELGQQLGHFRHAATNSGTSFRCKVTTVLKWARRGGTGVYPSANRRACSRARSASAGVPNRSKNLARSSQLRCCCHRGRTTAL